jgi:hypothetical protein
MSFPMDSVGNDITLFPYALNAMDLAQAVAASELCVSRVSCPESKVLQRAP